MADTTTDTRTFQGLEEEAIAKILALNTINVSRHSQGPSDPAAWRETEVPFTTLQDAANLGHLLFDVWIQDAPNSDLARGAEAGLEERTVHLSARMKVQFTYRLRPSKQKTDARAATGAAHDIVGVLMQEWTGGCVDVLLVNAMTVSLTLDGEWAMIQQDYIVGFDLDISLPTTI